MDNTIKLSWLLRLLLKLHIVRARDMKVVIDPTTRSFWHPKAIENLTGIKPDEKLSQESSTDH